MAHIHRIIAGLSLIALLATPAPVQADEPAPPFVCVVLDQFTYMPMMASNAAAPIVGDECTTDTCP